jgi:hypothetical protein
MSSGSPFVIALYSSIARMIEPEDWPLNDAVYADYCAST